MDIKFVDDIKKIIIDFDFFNFDFEFDQFVLEIWYDI